MVTDGDVNVLEFKMGEESVCSVIALRGAALPTPAAGSLVTVNNQRDQKTYRVNNEPFHYHFIGNNVLIELQVEPVVIVDGSI